MVARAAASAVLCRQSHPQAVPSAHTQGRQRGEVLQQGREGVATVWVCAGQAQIEAQVEAQAAQTLRAPPPHLPLHRR